MRKSDNHLVNAVFKQQSGVSRRFWLRQKWQQFLNLVFPDTESFCSLCRRPLPSVSFGTEFISMSDDALEMVDSYQQQWIHLLHGVCPFCIQDALEVVPKVQIHPLHVQDSFQPVVHVLSALTYEGFVRTCMRYWKYDGILQLTPWFGEAMKSAMLRVSFPIESYDALIAVPTALDRIKKRGYDQAQLLATYLHRCCQIPNWSVLRREMDKTGFTQSQTAKSVQERLQSLDGKFTCIHPALVRGKRFLLIDDVMTTGATLQVCSQILLRAGAKEVACVVAAYVP